MELLNFKQYLEAGSNIGDTGGGSHYDQGLIYSGSGSYMPPEEAARRQAHNAGIPFPTPLTPDVQQFYPEPTTINLQKKRKLKVKKRNKERKLGKS